MSTERKVTRVEINSDGVVVNGELVGGNEAARYRRMMSEEQHFWSRSQEYPSVTKEEKKWLGSTIVTPRRVRR